MRLPSRFRALLAVCALSAAVAACSDATAPDAASDLAPRRGRMLRPDQVSMLKPGDFIVIRPEEYAKYGIATFSASTATPSAYREYHDQCELTIDGPSPACCNDPSSQWYSSCPVEPQPCYDQYGNVRDCNDPCYDPYNNYTCPPPPTVTPATVRNDQNSHAIYEGEVNSGGTLLKQIRLVSWSQATANVASFTVDAQFKNVGAAGGGCNGIAGAFDFATGYATGNGYVEVSRVPRWTGIIKWQVDGTHTFNPISGASGGGTFYTTSTFCG